MPTHDEEAYDVGFGKPPKQSRFSKGVSGNPKGRPKGSRNVATVLVKALRKKVMVNENGVRRSITKLEAALTQLTNKAAAGDLVAMRQLTALASSAEEQVVVEPTGHVPDADLKIMQSVLKRFETSTKGEEN